MLNQLHPYFREILRLYAAAGRPPYHQLTPAEARAQLRSSLLARSSPATSPQLALVADEQLCVGERVIGMRRYLPPAAGPGVALYFHAGGWVLGDLDTGDALCRRLAVLAGCEVVSIDYRLAPEHPWPAALEDAWDALLWANERSPAVALVGESAGGNLAAACAIRAREAGIGLAGLLLAYPVLDHACDTDSYHSFGEGYLLTAADMAWFWDHYCPPGTDRADPWISPLRVADPAGLPPTFLCLAQCDPLRDEGLAFAHRLAVAGVPLVMHCEAGMLHGYLSAADQLAEARATLNSAGSWLAERMRAALG
ncbi:MAG: hypothetical protein KatS3mg124_1072 [Porticoccaceae bacterium]|nr:MAG: hypothetical protein KatS3mg124_1072 [Porticoccaceae bacterium]